MRARRSERGAATVEFGLVYVMLLLPLTGMLIFTAQLLWVWHSAADFTRDGARYAATHCWQGSGDNVASWMRSNVPLMIDREQFQGGSVDMVIQYFKRNAETGQMEEFSCDGEECSTACIPDSVTVRLRNYEFRHFMTFLGLPPVRMPEFQTSVPIESAGCDPDTATCVP